MLLPPPPGARAALAPWWRDRRCAAQWGTLVRPDGYDRWHEAGPNGTAEVDFFLECDPGSEITARVVAKLPGYASLAAATQPEGRTCAASSPGRSSRSSPASRQPARRPRAP